jgi:hypothetical protein
MALFGAVNSIYIIYKFTSRLRLKRFEGRRKKSVARDLKAALCLLEMFRSALISFKGENENLLRNCYRVDFKLMVR